MRKMMLALLILPFNVTIVIPYTIYHFSEKKINLELIRNQFAQEIAGFVILVFGILVAFYTFRLFFTVGKGTPAPWDPPIHLIIRGPYRFLRNPMIASVLLVLFAEALILHNTNILYWAFLFFVGNNIYIPLHEEVVLTKRYGQAYEEYRKNVPMWFPRLQAWRPEELEQTKHEAETKHD